jgi:hypothetical protein
VKAKRLDTKAAMEQIDEEEARERRGLPVPQWRPDLAEWGPTEELLATLADRIGDLEVIMANMPWSMNGKKGKHKVGPRYPRPKSGREQAERLRRVQRHNELDAEVQEAQQRWREMQAAQSGS